MLRSFRQWNNRITLCECVLIKVRLLLSLLAKIGRAQLGLLQLFGGVNQCMDISLWLSSLCNCAFQRKINTSSKGKEQGNIAFLKRKDLEKKTSELNSNTGFIIFFPKQYSNCLAAFTLY